MVSEMQYERPRVAEKGTADMDFVSGARVVYVTFSAHASTSFGKSRSDQFYGHVPVINA
jgi:hypothetical protein